MSPTVNNFVHDLVAMAKAMEDLPVVQAQLDESQKLHSETLDHAAKLEERILSYKHEIDALHAKVRCTEAERDDAELRFLESEDRTRSALDFIKTTFGSAGSLIQALEPPPKVEPVAQAEPEVKYEEPLSAAPSSAYAPDGTVSPGEQGQSEPLPTAIATPTEQSSNVTQSDKTIGVSASPTEHGNHTLPVTSFEEVPKSDANPPSVQDTSTTGEATGSNPSSADGQASQSVDDVGYHNEPDVGNDWSAWNAWCERMRQRYGAGAWPQRPDNAAPSVA